MTFLRPLFLSAWGHSATFVSGVAFLPIRHAAVLAAALLLLSRCDPTADLLPKLPRCSALFSQARRLLSNCLFLCSTVCLFRAIASSVCRLDRHFVIGHPAAIVLPCPFSADVCAAIRSCPRRCDPLPLVVSLFRPLLAMRALCRLTLLLPFARLVCLSLLPIRCLLSPSSPPV